MDARKTLILADWVLPISRDPIQDGGVVIQGTQIVDVGLEAEMRARYPEAEVVDRRPAILLPGMVNTHTHAAMVGFRGIADDLPLMEWLEHYIWPAEKKFVTPEFIETTLPLALVEMVRSGTVAFADMYFFQEVAGELTAGFGMRAVLAEGVIDFPTPAAPDPNTQLKRVEQLIQTFRDHPLIQPAVGPHAPYTCKPEVLQASRELADQYNVLVLTHIAETRAEVETIRERYGTTPVRHLHNLGFLDRKVVGAHSVWVDDEERALYRETDTAVAHCPESNLKLASGVAPLMAYLNDGIRVGLGTDGVASNNDLDMIGEMRTAALLHKGVQLDPTVASARTMVEVATLGGARVLHLDDRMGTLEPGKEADLMLVRTDRSHAVPLFDPYSWLVYAAKTTDVDSVWVRGKPLLYKGEIQGLDEEAIRARVRELALQISREVH